MWAVQLSVAPPPKRRKANTSVPKELDGHVDNDPTPNNDVDWGMNCGAG